MGYKFEPIIKGEYIELRKLNLDDAPDIFKWRTGESGKYMRHPLTYSIQYQIDWIKSRNSSEINYIIYQKHTLEKVGMIGIYDVNFNDSVANVGRLLLDESCLKKSTPFGLESLLVTYEYVFQNMNFRKICGDILATNTEMVKLQKVLGMQQEGYLKKHVVIGNKVEDVFIMSLFKEEFNNYKNKIKLLIKGFRK